MTEFKKTTVTIITKDGTEKANGYEYQYALADGRYIPMCVCNHRGGWQTVDPKTGRYLTKGSKTRADAVKLADSMEVKPAFTNIIDTEDYRKYVAEFERKAGIKAEPKAEKPKAPKAPKKPSAKKAAKKPTVKQGESELIDALIELEKVKRELEDIRNGKLDAEFRRIADEVFDEKLKAQIGADLDKVIDEFMPPKPEQVATVITLETMREWCEGKGLEAKQSHPGSQDNIWILGPSKQYQDELKAMGFRWARSSKVGQGWYAKPTA